MPAEMKDEDICVVDVSFFGDFFGRNLESVSHGFKLFVSVNPRWKEYITQEEIVKILKENGIDEILKKVYDIEKELCCQPYHPGHFVPQTVLAFPIKRILRGCKYGYEKGVYEMWELKGFENVLPVEKVRKFTDTITDFLEKKINPPKGRLTIKMTHESPTERREWDFSIEDVKRIQDAIDALEAIAEGEVYTIQEGKV